MQVFNKMLIVLLVVSRGVAMDRDDEVADLFNNLEKQQSVLELPPIATHYASPRPSPRPHSRPSSAFQSYQVPSGYHATHAAQAFSGGNFNNDDFAGYHNGHHSSHVGFQHHSSENEYYGHHSPAFHHTPEERLTPPFPMSLNIGDWIRWSWGHISKEHSWMSTMLVMVIVGMVWKVEMRSSNHVHEYEKVEELAAEESKIVVARKWGVDRYRRMMACVKRIVHYEG